MSLIHEHIYMRALEPHDIEILYDWENNIQFWMDSQQVNPYSKHLLNQFIAHQFESNPLENKQIRFVICLKNSTLAIGFIDLFDIDIQNSHAAIGILIGAEANRKKRYGTEALYLLEQYAFKYLNLNQLYAEVISNNQQSIHFFKQNNYQQTARKIDWIQRNKKFYDVLLFQKKLSQGFF